MTHDPELEALKAGVDCRAVLEHAGWQCDRAESTRLAAKYRGGPARIVIVTHDGRGWFDPLSDARGDVLALAQYLWGGSLGHARRALRPLAGIAPNPVRAQPARAEAPPLNAPQAWSRADRPAPGSQGWRYLTETRGLPPSTLMKAIDADVLREGIYGTVWALHRGSDRVACGWEMRGPRHKGFSKGGGKALFWIGDLHHARRVTIAEAAIDALSLATLEGWDDATVYVSTGGGFGPRTAATLSALLPRGARLVAATDRGEGGELLAGRLEAIARELGAGYSRLRPERKDWNEDLLATQQRSAT